MPASALRQLLLPPPESAEDHAGFERAARAGLSVLGAIAALAPIAGLVTRVLAAGRVLPVHAAITFLGVAALLLARTRAGRWSRTLGATGTVAVVYLMQRAAGPGLAPEVPYVVLLAMGALPFRPMQALGLAVGAGLASAAAGASQAAWLALALAPLVALISAVIYRGRAGAVRRRRELDVGLERLERAERRWRELLDRLGDAVILVDDRTGAVEPLNTRFEELLGLPPGSARGAHFTRFLHPADLERVIDNHLARVRGDPVPERYVLRLLHSDGSTVTCELSGRRSPDHQATVVALRHLEETLAAAG